MMVRDFAVDGGGGLLKWVYWGRDDAYGGGIRGFRDWGRVRRDVPFLAILSRRPGSDRVGGGRRRRGWGWGVVVVREV